MLIKTFPNLPVYNIGEITIIGSSYTRIRFKVTSQNGSPIDLTYMIPVWVLSPIEQQDYAVLAKNLTGHNGYFIVEILPVDTINLSGKYIQKPSITGVPDYDYKLGQGIINIIPAIGRS